MGSKEVLHYSLPIKFKIVSTTTNIHIYSRNHHFNPQLLWEKNTYLGFSVFEGLIMSIKNFILHIFIHYKTCTLRIYCIFNPLTCTHIWKNTVSLLTGHFHNGVCLSKGVKVHWKRKRRQQNKIILAHVINKSSDLSLTRCINVRLFDPF